MTNRIYLFSYYSTAERNSTEECMTDRLSKLYDVKKVHSSLFLIKTTDDITLLEKYLIECLNTEDTFYLVDITEKEKRFKNTDSSGINSWAENI